MRKFICILYVDYVTTNVNVGSPFFWDVALHHWVTGARCFNTTMLSWNIQHHPVNRCHIPEQWRPRVYFSCYL